MKATRIVAAGPLDRRRVLQVCGGIAAWPLVSRFGRPRRSAFDRLVELLIDTPREDLAAALEPVLAGGVTWSGLEAAVFAAGIREIRPRPVGFKLHAVLVSESVLQLGEASTTEQALLGTLWHADDFKNSQARDVSEGDWTLGPAPSTGSSRASKSDVARELELALSAGDAERADLAITVATGELDQHQIFEVLFPFAIRDYLNLGHKAIFTSHVDRVLRRFPSHAELDARDTLRSLVYGLLDGAPVSDHPGRTVPTASARLKIHERNVRTAQALRPNWNRGRRDPERSWEIALELRDGTPADAGGLMAASLEDGMHPATLWDAIRLAAADLFARRPGLLPVHPTTVSNSLHDIYLRSTTDLTRRVALLQAAAWIPVFRDELKERVRLPMGLFQGLEPLTDESPPTSVDAEETLRSPSPPALKALLDSTGDATEVVTTMRSELYRNANEQHQPKYAAAVIEDLKHAAPRWHPLLLAHVFEYLPGRSAPTSRLAERHTDLVRRVLR